MTAKIARTGKVDFFRFEVFAGPLDPIAATHYHSLDEEPLERLALRDHAIEVEKVRDESRKVEVQHR